MAVQKRDKVVDDGKATTMLKFESPKVPEGLNNGRVIEVPLEERGGREQEKLAVLPKVGHAASKHGKGRGGKAWNEKGLPRGKKTEKGKAVNIDAGPKNWGTPVGEGGWIRGQKIPNRRKTKTFSPAWLKKGKRGVDPGVFAQVWKDR